jgi:hypothetical protein
MPERTLQRAMGQPSSPTLPSQLFQSACRYSVLDGVGQLPDLQASELLCRSGCCPIGVLERKTIHVLHAS